MQGAERGKGEGGDAVSAPSPGYAAVSFRSVPRLIALPPSCLLCGLALSFTFRLSLRPSSVSTHSRRLTPALFVPLFLALEQQPACLWRLCGHFRFT